MAKIELCEKCQEHARTHNFTMLCKECDEKTRAQHIVMVKKEDTPNYRRKDKL